MALDDRIRPCFSRIDGPLFLADDSNLLAVDTTQFDTTILPHLSATYPQSLIRKTTCLLAPA